MAASGKKSSYNSPTFSIFPTSVERPRPVLARKQPKAPEPRSSTTPAATNKMHRHQTRASIRFSTYSMAPSFTPTVQTSNSAHAEIGEIATGLDRMENKALASQRVVLTEEKTDNMGKLALGAKLERALDRRMSSQDAVMRPRRKISVMENKFSEKV